MLLFQLKKNNKINILKYKEKQMCFYKIQRVLKTASLNFSVKIVIVTQSRLTVE